MATHGETLNGDLYCHSSAMRDVMTLVTQAAAVRAGVMIQGEVGTGRQRAARAVHGSQGSQGSKSSQGSQGGAFVVVDCAALDADELDARLFGTVTGRSNGDGHPGHNGGLERVGTKSLLHAASGGTLYFQNIAEAATRIQSRLARILRDREAVLAETGETIELDIRPIAGVEPGIDSLVQEGRVRDDLFRRIAVIRIEMPPLRNRREDIPALTNHFVEDTCARLRVPAKNMTRAALALVSALPWRGNASELRTLVEAVVSSLGARPEIGPDIGIDEVLAHVRLDGGAALPVNVHGAHGVHGLDGGGGTLRQARARFERDYIATVLEQHRGRISEAAKALGIQRTNLYRKMRSLRVTKGRQA